MAAGLAAAGLCVVTAACGSNPKPQVRRYRRAGAARRPRRPPSCPRRRDPIATLIAPSQEHFDAGERELKLGHLDRARVEFDRAVDVLLESPYGARTDARMREHFDRLIDRINAYEVTALAQGDGFAETKYEPASIDEMLKIATLPEAGRRRRRRPKRSSGPRARPRTTFRFRRTPRVLVLRRAVPGPAARVHPGRA